MGLLEYAKRGEGLPVMVLHGAGGGYYIKNQDSLLKGFEQSVALISDDLTKRYRADFAATLKTDLLSEFEQLLPEIPYIKGGARAKMFNFFLLITAQELRH